jgi:hypothetical protein
VVSNVFISTFINLLLLFGATFLLYNTDRKSPLKQFFWSGWAVKMFAGIALGLVYTYLYAYKGDTFAYFDEAQSLSNLFKNNSDGFWKVFWNNDFSNISADTLKLHFKLTSQPRAFAIAKILMPFCYLANGNYWIVSLYCSFLSFFGMWKVANSLVKIFPNTHLTSAISFLYFPSIVFWSSGVSKEAFVMLALGLSISFLLKLMYVRKFSSWLFLAFCAAMYFLFLVKYYYLIAFIFGISIWFFLEFIRFLNVKKLYFSHKKYSIIFTLLLIFPFTFLLLGIMSTVHPNLSLHHFLEALLQNHDATLRVTHHQGFIHFYNLEATWTSILLNLPIALFSGLFEPFMWQTLNIQSFLIGIENNFLLVLLFFSLSKVRSWYQKAIQTPIFWGLLAYILVLAIFLAFSSPNWGAISRYKIAFMPFWVYLLLLPTIAKKIPDNININ